MRALQTPFRSRWRAGALLCRFVALLVVVCAPGWVWAFTPAAIDGHVTDPSRQLPLEVERALEVKLAIFRAETTDEVAVYVVPSLGGATIEDAAYATFQVWRLGDAAKDNGVLLVWAPSERRVRIETGRGIGDRLTDVASSRILREVVIPRLKAGENAEGITAGVDAILTALRPTASAAVQTPPRPATPTPREGAERDSGAGGVVLALMLAVFAGIGVIVAKALARASSPTPHRARGRVGSGIGSDASVHPSSHRTPPWTGFHDGGGSSWDASSSGGSDFSGGGGESGGGGASDSY